MLGMLNACYKISVTVTVGILNSRLLQNLQPVCSLQAVQTIIIQMNRFAKNMSGKIRSCHSFCWVWMGNTESEIITFKIIAPMHPTKLSPLTKSRGRSRPQWSQLAWQLQQRMLK